MAGVNKVILLGNLGADPEVKHFEGDKMVANLRLATTESYRDKNNQKVEVTEWHDVELWDGLAKIASQYLKKGDTIYIEGKIKTDTWVDDQGNNRKKIKVRGTQMTMIKTGTSSGSGGNTNAPKSSSTPVVEDMPQSDDLPF
ncbi:MAG: single-stranded DNA-binding protein [Flammeovirgaceae bacterium]